MSNCVTKFRSAIFASCLASIPLATMAHSAAREAEQCLSGPKQEAPQGSHWYYRIDHTTKRHCWYLGEERGEERGKAARAVASNSSRRAAPESPKAEEAMQPSIANAHAELPAPSAVEQPTHDDAPAPVIPNNAAIVENAMSATNAPRWIVGSRWPDQSDASPPAQPAPDKPASPTSASSVSRPPPIAVADQVAAALPSPETPAYSVPMQLAALIGALAIAGIIGGIAFKFGTARGPDFSRLADETEDRDERIADFFAQMSRRRSS
ncbi:hypothetical protein SAMN05444159_0400 [Bradyrhizobium lablabi]|uniref:WW domain-containing protein n=1 Tax=Bradyrhizobium lablabi TaxID=722472 RepID=A0A1M6ILW1_9BRAD|nr:hypothetical protein [Bradyrhizobium lablabi]SHJ35363.1 hypothetical protein SAMN05444159_0400 [Bradyrhizobium lablabi]